MVRKPIRDLARQESQMYVSDWSPEKDSDDCVIEAFAYLSSPAKDVLLSPVMRLRAVQRWDGQYEALIRDPGTGVLLDHDERASGLEDAKHRAKILAHRFLKAAASTPRPQMTYLVGWYNSIPEEGSTGTHLIRKADAECAPICGEKIAFASKRWEPQAGTKDCQVYCRECRKKATA